jgi:hypothetical protein
MNITNGFPNFDFYSLLELRIETFCLLEINTYRDEARFVKGKKRLGGYSSFFFLLSCAKEGTTVFGLFWPRLQKERQTSQSTHTLDLSFFCSAGFNLSILHRIKTLEQSKHKLSRR